MLSSQSHLIDKIAGFTALRDIELLEISLLTTLYGILNPRSIKFIKINSKGAPIRETFLQNEKCETHTENIQVDKELQSAIKYLEESEQDQTTQKLTDGYISTFILNSDRRSTTYLCFESHQKNTMQTDYMLNGIFQVYRNYSKLLQESQTDKLTGLSNRKTFDEAIIKTNDAIPESEVEIIDGDQREQHHHDTATWLAILDIDFFKKVNDTYGHLYGDEVLMLFANLMKTTFREADQLFRFGGEEFVIILKSYSQEGCRLALERFRQAVEQHEFPGVGHITVSIGAVQMDPAIFHVTLLDHADQALYYSKEHGRNQLNFFEDLTRAGKIAVEQQQTGDIELF